ncbi:MAG: ImmA/IrrE family metallo-endopeptidase [Deinococcales bacterium]
MLQSEHKEHVRRLAAEFNALYRAREPLDLARAIGVRLEYGDLGDKDGAYDPERNVVFLSRRASPERQRFTMAHEVTHFLILTDEDFLSDLHDAYEGDHLEENIEVLCNIGASEILVPRAELEPLLLRYGASARGLAKIVKNFGVSKPAACVALVEHMQEAAIVAVCRAKGKTQTRRDTLHGGGNQARVLEVSFAAKTELAKYSLAHGSQIPTDHPLHVALTTGLPLEQRTYVPFKSGKKMPALMDAHPDGSTVMVVFRLEV